MLSALVPPTFYRPAVIAEDHMFNNVDDFLQHLSARTVTSPATPSSSQQQQQPGTLRQKRRATSDPPATSPSVETRILEMTRSRTASKSVNATFCMHVLATLDSRDGVSAKRLRDEIYNLLDD